MTTTDSNPLADLLVCACARVWEHDGEVLASGIGLIQRLGASVAMTKNPDLMMTDSEAYMVSEPVPVGSTADYAKKRETWMGFSRIFDNVWSGARHALVGPTQVDRFGQANISAIGSHEAPKVQMLGMRGFPGNSISHINSFFVPAHSKRVFVEGEVDTVCSVGYNPDRLPRGYTFDDIHVGFVITNLCVLDFGGANHACRLVSVHPGVTVEQVVEQTGFELETGSVVTTPMPTQDELDILDVVDPRGLRNSAVKA